MTIERIVRRPHAVKLAIANLEVETARIDEQRELLTRIALDLQELGADVTPLADASHDLEHAWRHLTSVRRALVMSWPVDLHDDLDAPSHAPGDTPLENGHRE